MLEGHFVRLGGPSGAVNHEVSNGIWDTRENDGQRCPAPSMRKGTLTHTSVSTRGSGSGTVLLGNGT